VRADPGDEHRHGPDARARRVVPHGVADAGVAPHDGRDAAPRPHLSGVLDGRLRRHAGTIPGRRRLHPSQFLPGRLGIEASDTSRFPVDSATWEEADRFCRTLTRRERVEATGWEYRLPTEAEWEYACRAWISTRWPFHFGRSIESSRANFDAQYLYPRDYDPDRPTIGHPVEVGRYTPNAFGLYDMHGNIDEWCSDWFDGGYYRESPIDDPTGPPDGSSKCYRGGAWSGQGEDCRAAVRIGRLTDDADDRIGFRVVLARVRG